MTSEQERNTALVLQQLLPDVVFKKVRPYWLKNPKTNACLEIDLYCEELSLGIEVNGEQHYKPGFGSSQEAFHEQMLRDAQKQKICAARKVHLVTIPYTVGKSQEEIAEYLKIAIHHYLPQTPPSRVRTCCII